MNTYFISTWLQVWDATRDYVVKATSEEMAIEMLKEQYKDSKYRIGDGGYRIMYIMDCSEDVTVVSFWEI